jgi:hypothetical protein
MDTSAGQPRPSIYSTNFMRKGRYRMRRRITLVYCGDGERVVAGIRQKQVEVGFAHYKDQDNPGRSG